MELNVVKDKYGRVIALEDQQGNVKWTREDSVRRDKISEASKQALLDAVVNKNGDKFRRHVFEILTGETVSEAQK